MTVRDILEVCPGYIDVHVCNENNKFTLYGKPAGLLESADFIMMRKVGRIDIDGHGPLSRWPSITMAPEEEVG